MAAGRRRMYEAVMRILNVIVSSAVLTASATPALAGAGNFTIVNATGSALSNVAIRRTTTNDWKPLDAAPAPGARQSVTFSDPDCAFDIRGTVAGAGQVVWGGVNLCDAKSVILNRNASGEAWVDYD